MSRYGMPQMTDMAMNRIQPRRDMGIVLVDLAVRWGRIARLHAPPPVGPGSVRRGCRDLGPGPSRRACRPGRRSGLGTAGHLVGPQFRGDRHRPAVRRWPVGPGVAMGERWRGDPGLEGVLVAPARDHEPLPAIIGGAEELEALEPVLVVHRPGAGGEALRQLVAGVVGNGDGVGLDHGRSFTSSHGTSRGNGTLTLIFSGPPLLVRAEGPRRRPPARVPRSASLCQVLPRSVRFCLVLTGYPPDSGAISERTQTWIVLGTGVVARLRPGSCPTWLAADSREHFSPMTRRRSAATLSPSRCDPSPSGHGQGSEED